jgi:Flp pilus assembly CpaF family ATPase
VADSTAASVNGRARPPAAGPGVVSAIADLPGALPGALPVGLDVIAELRQAVSRALVDEIGDRALPEASQRELGRALVTRHVASWSTAYARTARVPLTPDQEEAVRQAVYAALFRAGPLQPLLDDDRVENIVIDAGRVWLDYADAPRVQAPPVAGSDAELVDLVNALAARAGLSERALTPATPQTDFRLPDGSRVAASMPPVVPRPVVVIRRHRVRHDGLAELHGYGTLDSVLAAFFTAAVRAGKSVMIAGDMGAGKTTLLRALARQIPPEEVVVTVETDRELYLHEDTGGPLVVSFEARAGNGERGAGGRAAGEITVEDLIPRALRYNASRIVVGEVRSAEIVAMFDAMSAGGAGSLCTIHVRKPSALISRMVTLVLRSGPQMSVALAHQMIADAVDFIVYLRRVNVGGRRLRFVAEVREVVGLSDGGRPATQVIFGPADGEPRAVPRAVPSCAADLEQHGFHRRWITEYPRGDWRTPPPVGVVPL